MTDPERAALRKRAAKRRKAKHPKTSVPIGGCYFGFREDGSFFFTGV